ncbi:hypothetical protein [Muricomes intestini]|mgnify:CR=1 FL=1|uniref:hypothetical protein n=1 Tax=Muricomes intestini TaxID=1796634 RepID=UPI002FE017AF
MSNIIEANFKLGEYITTGKRTDRKPIWQWAYGQVLRVTGLNLPTAVEVHFKHSAIDGDAQIQIGATENNVMTVDVPNEYMNMSGVITTYIYCTTVDHGQTEYKIQFAVSSREKPESLKNVDEVATWHETIEIINAAADRAETAEGNAKQHAEEAVKSANSATDTLHEISGEVEDAKDHIDDYVIGKEHELKGETGDVSFASFAVDPPRLLMFNDPTKTKIEFNRRGSKLTYKLNPLKGVINESSK